MKSVSSVLLKCRQKLGGTATGSLLNSFLIEEIENLSGLSLLNYKWALTVTFSFMFV